MRQSEFGKRVSEARIQKGLTQKELADTCKVDIRTIQRIEAGEVFPRMYTAKILSGALGFSIDEVAGNRNSISGKNLALLLSFIFGIIFVANSVPQLLIQNKLATAPENHAFLFAWIVLSVIHIVSAIFFFRGWYQIGVVHQVLLLKISSVMTFILIPLYIATFGLSIYGHFSDNAFLQGGFVVLTGISAIVFGIGLIRLNIGEKNLSEIAGILQVICGFMFLLPFDLLHLISFCLTIPANILLLILIYKERRATE